MAVKLVHGTEMVVAGFVILALGAAILGCAPHFAIATYGLPIGVFLAQLVAVAFIIVGFGALVSNTLWGFALSSRYAYSLSKMQMAGWTVLVLATLFTAAEIRIFGYFGAVSEPLNITIPGDLLAALGIAVFTTAATPAVLALKATGTSDTSQSNAAGQRLAGLIQTSSDNIANVGNVMVRNSPTLARWSDIVSGDEVANAGTVDLSKVQQLLITLLLLATYAAMIVNAISNGGIVVSGSAHPHPTPFDSLPELSPYFVGLMAISHAGYLTYKAVPKPAPTATTNPGAPMAPTMIGPPAAPPRQR